MEVDASFNWSVSTWSCTGGIYIIPSYTSLRSYNLCAFEKKLKVWLSTEARQSASFTWHCSARRRECSSWSVGMKDERWQQHQQRQKHQQQLWQQWWVMTMMCHSGECWLLDGFRQRLGWPLALLAFYTGCTSALFAHWVIWSLTRFSLAVTIREVDLAELSPSLHYHCTGLFEVW